MRTKVLLCLSAVFLAIHGANSQPVESNPPCPDCDLIPEPTCNQVPGPKVFEHGDWTCDACTKIVTPIDQECDSKSYPTGQMCGTRTLSAVEEQQYYVTGHCDGVKCVGPEDVDPDEYDTPRKYLRYHPRVCPDVCPCAFD